MQTPDVLSPRAADASVRPATAADVPALGAVHARSWRAAYASTLPADVLAALDPQDLAEAWRGAVTDPPGPRHRVLVACAGPTVVGFAATAPLPAQDAADGGDPATSGPGGPGTTAGAELVALHVDPAHQRRGHGSRLLQAAVDHLRGDGAAVLATWCPTEDDARRIFLTSAGMGPDGSWRDLAVPGGEMREVRLVAALDDGTR